MTGLGVAYTWLVIKVTLLAAVVAALYLPGGRGAGIRRGFLVTAGLLSILGLSLSLFVPFPNWAHWAGVSNPPRAQVVPAQSPPPEAVAARPIPNGPLLVPDREAELAEPSPAGQPEAGLSVALPFPEAGVGRPDKSPAQPPTPIVVRAPGTVPAGPRTPATPGWGVRIQRRIVMLSALVESLCSKHPQVRSAFQFLGYLLAAALGLGLLRLVVALWSVAQFRRNLRPVQDARLLEGLDIVLAATSCQIPVQLMTGPELSSPATLGVRQPCIVVPTDHADWSDEQIQGVLAHEVGHVLHRDYLWWCLAQVVMIFHFFNPLVRQLVYWLRLQQELGADAVAVQVVGSSRRYLEVLASMAVREHEQSLPLTARTFLPVQGTLASRIEMLRAGQWTGWDRPGRGRRAIGFGLALLACGLAGLRLETRAGWREPGRQLSRVYIPAAVRFIAAVQPDQIIQWPPVIGWSFSAESRTLYGEPLEGFEQVTAFRTRLADDLVMDPQGFSGLVLHCRTPEMAERLAAHARSGRGGNQAHEWAPFQLMSNRGLSVRVLAPQVVVLTTVPEELDLCQAAADPALATEAWQTEWDRQGRAAVRVALTSAGLQDWLAPVPDNGGVGEPAPAVHLRPEWRALLSSLEPVGETVDSVLLSVGGGTASDLQLAVVAPPEGDLRAVEHSTQGLIASLRCLLHNGAGTELSDFGADQALQLPWQEVANAIESWALPGPVQSGRSLVWSGEVDWRGSGWNRPGQSHPGSLLADSSLWEQGQNRVAARNLARALQRFRAAQGRWPTSQERLRPQDPPHSWRVAVLPYLGMRDLYNLYHFDKPWDDPANRPVLARMPDLFSGVGSAATTTQWILPTTRPGLKSVPKLVDGMAPDGTEFQLLATRDIVIPWTLPDVFTLDAELMTKLGRTGGQAVLLTSEGELVPHLIPSGSERVD